MIPPLALSCLLNPARERINSRDETMYAAVAIIGAIVRRDSIYLPPFENMLSIRLVTAKPPKMLMLAKVVATPAKI